MQAKPPPQAILTDGLQRLQPPARGGPWRSGLQRALKALDASKPTCQPAFGQQSADRSAASRHFPWIPAQWRHGVAPPISRRGKYGGGRGSRSSRLELASEVLPSCGDHEAASWARPPHGGTRLAVALMVSRRLWKTNGVDGPGELG